MFGNQQDSEKKYSDDEGGGGGLIKLALITVAVLFLLTPGLLVALLLSLFVPFAVGDSVFWQIAIIVSILLFALIWYASRDHWRAARRYLTICVLIWVAVFAIVKGVEFIQDNWTPKSSSQSSKAVRLATISVPSARVRSGPGIEYDIVGGLMQGTEVEILSEAQGWFYIRAPSQEGYVKAALLKVGSSLAGK